MYKVHGDYISGNCYKVKLILTLLGKPYQWVPVDILKGETQSEAFLALNPNGKIPVLELEDGTTLWESNAIVRYLAARYAAGRLYPEDPVLRARGDKWMDWTTSAFAPVFRDLFWGTLRTPPAERDPAKIAAALARCSELLAMPERALADIDPEHMAKAFAVNATGPALLMKHCLPLLPERLLRRLLLGQRLQRLHFTATGASLCLRAVVALEFASGVHSGRIYTLLRPRVLSGATAAPALHGTKNS